MPKGRGHKNLVQTLFCILPPFLFFSYFYSHSKRTHPHKKKHAPARKHNVIPMHTETNDAADDDDDDDDDDESARFFRTTTTKKKTENEFGRGEKKKNTRILIFSVLALLLFLLYWRSIRLTSSTHSTDDRAEAMAMAAKEDEIMRNLRYPGSTTTTTIGKKKRKKEFTSQGQVKVLVDTNLQNEKEIKREGRKLLQFLAPVRYSLVPLSDAIQDLVEAMFDLSITPLQAKIAPFLKFRESNVTDPKDPLVIDKEKVKEAIIKETLP